MTSSSKQPHGIFRRPWHDIFNALHGLLVRLKTMLYYRQVFGSVGRGSLIYKPMLLTNPRFVHIGKRTMIRPGVRIEAIVLNDSAPPCLTIGNNVNIEQNVHLICSSHLVIGDNVSIIGHCAIVDTSHPYQDIDDPRKVGDRLDTNPKPVSIGNGSFLGFGCIILPGVNIGSNCVIGANSTVTRDVPDYSVATGNPARVVKHYDHGTAKWVESLSTDRH